MSDERLAQLFTDGTAPERDAAFARRVQTRIGLARLGPRLLALSIRGVAILVLAAMAFVAASALESIGGSLPQFMGVPLPLVLIALAIGLAWRLRGRVVLAWLSLPSGGRVIST